MATYWDNLVRNRVTRRRALLGAGGLTMSAAFLAACGSDDGDSPATGGSTGATGSRGSTGSGGATAPGGATGATGGASAGSGAAGLLTAPENTSSAAKYGGVLNDQRNADTDNLDPFSANSSITSGITAYAFDRLTTIKLGEGQDPDGSFMPQLAESMEWSPDNLQLIFHLRPGVKWHNIAPVNGREMDMEDVLYSWRRFEEIGLLRSELVNSVNPDAPVLGIEATDDRTVVFNLKEPIAYLPTLLATPNSGNPHIAPRESEDQFDLRTHLIGSGPFMLDKYEPSVGWRYVKNPDYWGGAGIPEVPGGYPFLDEINITIIPEYATSLAQFEAGNLTVFNLGASDILAVKERRPQLLMYEAAMAAIGQRTIFGWNPGPIEVNPFRDQRVRQAYSMSWDRDLFIEVYYDTTTLENYGLEIEKRWNSELQANFFPGWWLDPKGPDFGPNVKYMEHNIEEGKKLMAAAGFEDGVEVTASYFTSAQWGSNMPNFIEILHNMAAEVGIRHVPNIIDFATDYPSKYRDGAGRFDGLSYKLGPSGGGDDAIGRLIFFNHSRGGGFTGHDVNGVGDFSGDPWVDETLNAAKREMDTERRKAMAQEVQRYLAEKMYTIRWPGGATAFQLAWPAVKNYRWFRGGPSAIEARVAHTLWLDQDQPPFA